MRFGVAQPVLLLVICVTACSSKPPVAWQPFPNGLDENLQAAAGISEVRPAPDGPPPLSITAKPAEGAVFTSLEENHGTLFTIRNDSKKAIIVLRIEPVTNAGEGIILMSCFPVGGPGIHDFGPDKRTLEYKILQSIACCGEVPAHACFLLPGQSFVFSCDDKEFQNAYFPVATKEVFAVTYIATEHDYEAGSNALNSWDVFCCDKTPFEGDLNRAPLFFHFVPFKHDDWIIRVAYGTQWPLSYEEMCHRGVVIRNMPKSAWITRVEVAFPWQEGKSLDSAGKQIAASLGDAAGEFSFCYSEVLKAFLVRQPDRTILYDPTDLRRPLEVFLPFPPSMLAYDPADEHFHFGSKGEYAIFLGDVRGADDVQPQSRRRGSRAISDSYVIGNRKLWGKYAIYEDLDLRYGGPQNDCVSLAPGEVRDFLRRATGAGVQIIPRKEEYNSADGILLLRRYNGTYELHRGSR